MNAPFIDLKAQYQAHKPAMVAAIQSVLDRVVFSMGSEVTAFEHIISSGLMVSWVRENRSEESS